LNGIVFGKTNVPDFAGSLVTCNYANGCTQNAHGRTFTVAGSSGGSGSAVASHLAPLALTEDTGGSTRGPAFMNGNFGYDPTRHHYPNAGNPGMSYILDQMGVNARSIDDVILFDEIYHGYETSSFIGKPCADLKIGLPLYPFVESYIPANGHNPFHYTTAPTAFKPSVEIMAKYNAAKAALATAGATFIEEEWPTSASGNNALAEAWFLTEMEPGMPVSMCLDVFISYAGQMANYLANYLNVTISPLELMRDALPAGAGHAPAGFMGAGLAGDEVKLEFIMHVLRPLAIKVWNSYFDTHGVDFILVPGMLHFETYPCQAASTCTHQEGNLETGVFKSKSTFTAIHSLFMHTLAMKHIPYAKVMVPVGLDPQGRPVGLQFMSRSGPVGAPDMTWMFDHQLLKTIDVTFLKNVKAAVDGMVAVDPSLARANPKMVTGVGNLYS
jgi:Asp-tRNA(Asn)/Glu-tRNA(Gln) amidotransferase A subunit family amidase